VSDFVLAELRGETFQQLLTVQGWDQALVRVGDAQRLSVEPIRSIVSGDSLSGCGRPAIAATTARNTPDG
jgi:hypothetical protein